MKKFVLAAAFAGVASAGFAGSLDAPVMEPEVVVEESSGTSTGAIVLPIMLLLVIAAAASN